MRVLMIPSLPLNEDFRLLDCGHHQRQEVNLSRYIASTVFVFILIIIDLIVVMTIRPNRYVI